MVAHVGPHLRMVLLGTPVGQGRGRAMSTSFGPRVYDPPRAKAWKRNAAAIMQVRAAGAGWEPATRPVALVLDAVFALPKDRRRGPQERTWRPSAPDGDNLLKAVQDAANGVLWADDALVVDARVRKWYAAPGEPPCVELEVWEV